MASYYFDANALLKYSILQDYKSWYETPEKGISEIKNLVTQEDNIIFYSSLSLLESWSVIFRCYRGDILGKKPKNKNKALQRIINQLQIELQQAHFARLDTNINETTLIQANRLIERYGITNDVGTLDMVHIALIKQSTINNLIMVSSDKVVKMICQKEIINIFDPQSIEI